MAAYKLVVKLAVSNDDGRKQGVEVCLRSNGANKGASIFFCSLLLRCNLLAKKVPRRAPYSQHCDSVAKAKLLTDSGGANLRHAFGEKKYSARE